MRGRDLERWPWLRELGPGWAATLAKELRLGTLVDLGSVGAATTIDRPEARRDRPRPQGQLTLDGRTEWT
jgi:hypothetical protein